MLADAREDIAKADQKASLVLAVLGIAVAAVLGGVLAGNWSPSQLSNIGQPLWWVGTTTLTIAFGFSAAAVWPRYDDGEPSAGIYYWANVAWFESLSEFVTAIADDPPDEAARTRSQLWHLSRIVSRKYQMIRIAITLSGLSVAFAVAAVWLHV